MIEFSRSFPKFLFPLLLLVSGCTGIFEDISVTRESDETVVSAKSFFEEEVLRMCTKPCENNSFYFGNIAPEWSSAVVEINRKENLRNVECEVATTYRYRVLCTSEGSSRVRKVLFHQRLLVTEDLSDETLGVFIVLYVSDPTYDKSHRGRLPRGIGNGGEMKDFNGMKLYCTLDGRLYRANLYEQGNKVDGLSCNDLIESDNITSASESMSWLCGGMRIQRGRTRVATRSSMDAELDPAYCWGDSYRPFDDPHFWMSFYDDPDDCGRSRYSDPNDMSSGGGASGGGRYSTTYQSSQNTYIDRWIEEMYISGGTMSQVQNLKDTFYDERVKNYMPIKNLLHKLDKSKISFIIQNDVKIGNQNCAAVCLAPNESGKIIIKVNASYLQDPYCWPIFEELLHAYQYQSSPDWTTGDRELEAKVWISILYLEQHLYLGIDEKISDELIKLYTKPNDKTYNNAVDALRESPFNYDSQNYPITTDNTDPLKHLNLLF